MECMSPTSLALNAISARENPHLLDTTLALPDEAHVLLDRDDFQIRLASGFGKVRNNVSMLVERLYAWKGLQIKVPESPRANELTLAVYDGTHLFGTLSIGLDSSSGLFVDELYKDIIDEYRTAGAKPYEITRFAIDPCNNSKEVLAAIFNLAYIYARHIHGMSDVFIEVNPRHVPFYKRMLCFQEVGGERFCERVGAPARLLHPSMDRMDNLIAEFGGRNPATNRSNLYPLFFCQEEQGGIVARLRRKNFATIS